MTRAGLPTGLLERARAARAVGRLDEARLALAEALRANPHDALALLMLGDLQAAAGRLDAAAATLQRAVEGHPAAARAWGRLGEVYEQLGRGDEALHCLARAAELEPGYAEAGYNLARLLRGHRDFARARQALERAMGAARQPAPQLAAAMLQLLALLHEDAGELQPALTALERALGIAPDRGALHHNRGVLLHRLARDAEALPAYERALALGVDAADLHYNRGNALQALGQTALAIDAYRAALAREPQHGLALYDLARLRWRLGDPAFDDELLAAATLAPDSALAPGIRGRLLLRAERYDEASVAFGRAAELDPQSAGYLDGLGQALSRLGRHVQALDTHDRAIERAPDHPAVHVSQATSQLRAGHVDAAAQAAERAVRLAPLDQEAWAVLGTTWRAAGHPGDGWLNDYQQHVRVFDLAPPAGWSSAAEFNAALAARLHGWHTDTREPIDQTLRGGSQTLGNLFQRRDDTLAQLVAMLGRAIDAYVDHLRVLPTDDDHPLLGRLAGGWRFSDAWSSRLRRGGFHTRHVHPHGWISSCYYVAVPPSVARAPQGASRAGWLELGVPDIDVPGRSFPPGRVEQPTVGRLVLFPSFMWHGTVPFHDEEPRLTVAFDVLPVD